MTDSIDLRRIQDQREQVQSDIANAEAKIAYLKSVLADLDASERVITFFSEGSFAETNPKTSFTMPSHAIPIAYHSGIPKGHCEGNPFRKGTNKAYIWDALASAEGPWIDANEIQDKASILKGDEIPMATISPTLSNMKGEYIERNGFKVALKSRLNENGEAETSPDADEVTASSNN